MAQRKGHEVDAFVNRPEAGYSVILVYGPNGGLVWERSRQLARSAVEEPDDPFQLIRLEGDEIASDPLRLADEANTMGLFGGNRSIWVRAGSRNLTPAVAPLLSAPPQDCRVVVQAGDLQARNPLRVAVEAARTGMALPCYADEARDLAALVDRQLRERGLGIEREAREAMVACLGADRAMSLNEIEKLALFAHGAGTVTPAHVEAVMADASAVALDSIIDAAFTGDARTFDAGLERLLSEGEDPGLMVSALLRHACTLHKARLSVDQGGSTDGAVQASRVFFKRKQSFTRQLGLWSSPALEGVVELLRETQAATRKQPRLAPGILSRAMLQIASRARR